MNTPLEQVREDCKLYALRLEKLGNCSPALREVSLRCARKLQRAGRRFDSKLVLMATIGSVKSGKSTLTNCLAHRELCATKLGQEMTQKPLIILSSDDGTERMELYSAKAASLLQEQELFELVIDHLRHAESPDFEAKIAIDRRELNEQNLDAWASNQSSASCAVIFLVEPRSRLLQAGFGIIDMPGMDGLKSNWQDEKLHTWMNRHADYFLLAQSSFAALTPDTRNYLKAAMQHSPRPIRLVQNRIEAQHWLNEQNALEQQNEQQANTQKQLSDFLQKLVPSSWLNAGQTWWQMEGKTELNAPFLALESAILEDLSCPETTLRINSMDNLHKCLEAIDVQLKETQLQAEEQLSAMHALENEVHKLIDGAALRKALESGNLHEGHLRCKYLADEAKERICLQLDRILELQAEGYFPPDWREHRLTGEQLNHVLQKVQNDLGELFAEQETRVLAPEKICALTDWEQTRLTQLAQLLGRRKYLDIESDYTRDVLNAWQHVPLDCSPLDIEPLKTSQFLGMLSCKYDYEDLCIQWRSEGRAIISQRLEKWRRLAEEQLESFISERIDTFGSRVSLELSRFKQAEQLGISQTHASDDIKQINQLRDKLAPILLEARRIQASK